MLFYLRERLAQHAEQAGMNEGLVGVIEAQSREIDLEPTRLLRERTLGARLRLACRRMPVAESELSGELLERCFPAKEGKAGLLRFRGEKIVLKE